MNGFNLSNIQNAMLGSTQISALYYGSKLIWEKFHDYSLDYFTIEATTDDGADVLVKKNTTQSDITLSYSKDLINWTDYTVDETSLTGFVFLYKGEKLYIKSTNTSLSEGIGQGLTICAYDPYIVYGNIMSLLYGDNFANQTSLTGNYSFVNLFNESNNGLTDASNLILPATTLTGYCYYQMFRNCASLTSAPALPATTLYAYCYQAMFYGCTSLTSAPALPATTLYAHCYHSMFRDCTSLTSAPALPATTLADSCYYYMFLGCTSLTSAPALPATTLADSCYYFMFYGCTSLTSAPALPATTLADNCYKQMFNGCTSLIYPPRLLATTLANNCYQNMFYNCSSLTIQGMFPRYTLPAETLTAYCYDNMFVGCTSLTSAPYINAKTINSYSCRSMFWGCTSLTRSPYLKITQSASTGLNYMFSQCSSLNYIYIDFENPPSNGYLGFTDSVAASGTFVHSMNANWPVDSIKGIPSGWTRKMIVNNQITDYVAKDVPLTIESLGGNYPLLKITNSGNSKNIYYSTNGGKTFKTLSLTSGSFSWYLTESGSIQLKSDSYVNGELNFEFTSIDTTGVNYGCKVYGNLLSMGYSQNNAYKTQTSLTSNNEYKGLFSGCNVVDASGLLMITPNKQYVYAELFKNCTMLTKAPALPTPTYNYSHSNMFNGCTALVNPPIIPGTTIAYAACEGLFYGCTSLVDASDIMPNITTLNSECLRTMFYNCTSLTKAPVLPPVDTIPQGSMNQMFRGCTSLIKAPDLICTTIATWGCYNMFYDCTSLNYVKCTATALSGSSNTSSWLMGVSSTGTFVKDSNSTIWSTGISGIPSGWTVVDV